MADQPNSAAGDVTSPANEVRLASIFPRCHATPSVICDVVDQLSAQLQRPVIVVLQTGDDMETDSISDALYLGIRQALSTLPKGPVALLLDTPGGFATSAYRIARVLQRHCGSFDVVVPFRAKSAGTLLALGAERIIMTRDAELGPLDAQIEDNDRERRMSALEETMCLQRLNLAAVEAVDQQMLRWLYRTGKKTDSLLPTTMKFVSDMMRPMFEKLDPVHFTEMHRVMSVAKDYGVRLLSDRCGSADAQVIVTELSECYPEHEFVIDSDEALRVGLPVEVASDEIMRILDPISVPVHEYTHTSVLGLIERIKNHEDKASTGMRATKAEESGVDRSRDQDGQTGQNPNVGGFERVDPKTPFVIGDATGDQQRVPSKPPPLTN